MGFPSKLKNFNLFLDGVSHMGVAKEVTPPKFALKMEEYRGGGMLGPIMVDMGLDKMELEFTLAGIADAAFRKFGATRHDAALVRFAGAYQDDTSGQVRALEVIARGRYMETDMGNATAGGDTDHKYKLTASYCRLDVDGQTWIEVDLLNAIFIVFGVDRYAEIRAALGL